MNPTKNTIRDQNLKLSVKLVYRNISKFHFPSTLLILLSKHTKKKKRTFMTEPKMIRNLTGNCLWQPILLHQILKNFYFNQF